MSNYFRNFDEKKDFLAPREREFSRILSAAVINEKFRTQLLSNPEKAIKNGYNGEAFHLAISETHKLSMIHAASLAEFAAKMNSILA